MAKIELLAGEPQPRETKRAMLACNDYLRLGPGRSLAKLLNRYQAAAETSPTKRIATLKDWSSQFGWQERVTAYDAAVERRKTEQVEQRRRMALESGFALDYERVISLKKVATLLLAELYETDEAGHLPNLWLADVKQIGSGELAERIDLVRFNAALIEQLRGVLDDLAKETGGRKQKHELETPDLKPLPEAIRELAAKVYGQPGENTD